ncbi:OmpA family protein [Gilliamella sp. ESL0250]|uniref:OmpA family protein n=1 Tax=Gilliamella sp. ESL0250 TaxID=2705036 RepID=UPI001580E475|nr:OmpA family protein [Gilliamella sp. ESL0250]NUF49374.1 OmpA family protein [Gilliamella sp. ESL0250]
MSDYPKRIQIIYAAILSLLLLFVFLPIAVGWKIIGTVLVLVIAGGLLWRMQRYRRMLALSTTNIDFLTQKLDLLPARQRYRLPILLVTGSAAKDFFPEDLSIAESNIVVSSEAVWIYVEEYSHLPIVYDSLIAKWPDMIGRVGIFLALTPELEDKQGLFIAKLQAFRQSWADTCRIAKYQLPVYLSTHIGLNNLIYDEQNPLPVYWFQLVDHKLFLLDRYLSPLNNWVNDIKTPSSERERRLRLRPLLNEAQSWIEQVVLSTLIDPKQPIAKCNPTGIAIYPINQSIVNNNIMQKQWESITTLLLPNNHKIEDNVSPPDSLIKFMPIAYPFSPIATMACGLITITSIFIMGCLGASFWNNIKLSDQIQNDIRHYHLISMDSYEEKRQALELLKGDRTMLNQYLAQGEPVRLGMGLYHGQQLLEPLNVSMSDYVAKPPEPEKIIIKEEKVIMKEAPSVIRLDSLALFESGQSSLKSDSTKILVNALVEMKKQINANHGTGWLILVAGHTDSTGDENKNIQLSLERATAVRDWIIKASDIPETCFAIQGYGAKKPLVSNDTLEGRAQNRRVEISLVPQMSNCILANEN